MQIRINKVQLSTKQVDKIIESPDTINLSGVKSTRQRKLARQKRKFENNILPYIKFSVISILVIIWMVSIWNTSAEASDPHTIPTKSITNMNAFCDYLVRADEDRYKKECNKVHKVTKDIIDEEQGYYNEIKWGKYNQPIRVYDTRVNKMIEEWYSLTRVIDLTTLLTMECNRYDGKCLNGTSDIWPFQINRIAHKQAYLRSKELFYNSPELFKYQMRYANDEIVQRLEDEFCGWQYAKTNKIRFQCLAMNYNWNKKISWNGLQVRQNYAILAWEKRKQIAKYIVENYPLLTNN